MIIDYPWYYVLLCLLAGAIYAAALYAFGRKPFTRGLQWLLSVLRFLAVSAIAHGIAATSSARHNTTESTFLMFMFCPPLITVSMENGEWMVYVAAATL